MLLDCLSPAIPKGVLRIAVLSFSGVLRSLCGVAASAAKASLSVHFAKRGNVGELNAVSSGVPVTTCENGTDRRVERCEPRDCDFFDGDASKLLLRSWIRE